MSAYSDWKCGALSDDEYVFASRREFAHDDYDDIYTDDDMDEDSEDDETDQMV